MLKPSIGMTFIIVLLWIAIQQIQDFYFYIFIWMNKKLYFKDTKTNKQPKLARSKPGNPNNSST